MADVCLTRAEEDGKLPPVCMCCGSPATDFVERKFMLQEPIVRGPSGFAEIYVIRLLLAGSKVPRFTLRTSFCPEHRHFWRLRFALLFGGLAGLFAVLLGGLAVVALLIGVAKVNAPWVSAFAIVPLVLYMIAWIIPTKLAMDRSIRTRLTVDDRIELQNVGEAYVAAVKAQRQAPATSSSATIPTAILIVDKERPASPERNAVTPAPPVFGPKPIVWVVIGGVGFVVLLGCLISCVAAAFVNMAPKKWETRIQEEVPK